MALVSIDEESNKGSMWDLDQNLDQPMEEEAGRLKNMYREKVRCGFYILLTFILLSKNYKQAHTI